MYKLFAVPVMFLALLTGHMAYADTPEEVEMKCTLLAQDEEINQEDMPEYMKECIKNLTEQSK